MDNDNRPLLDFIFSAICGVIGVLLAIGLSVTQKLDTIIELLSKMVRY